MTIQSYDHENHNNKKSQESNYHNYTNHMKDYSKTKSVITNLAYFFLPPPEGPEGQQKEFRIIKKVRKFIHSVDMVRKLESPK